jgi:hypothetical protein
MKSLLAENVFTVAGLLTASECRDLIERGEAIHWFSAGCRPYCCRSTDATRHSGQ